MKTDKLHEKQEKILNILKQHQHDGITIRDIQEMLDISSTSVVMHHIGQLEKKGFIKRNPYNPRDYQIIGDSPEKAVTYLNLYGMGQCGPRGLMLDGNPIDRIPISSRIISFPVDNAFLIKAKGDSMIPRIHEGDLVIAQKSNAAENGEIVVCVHNGEVIIKRFYREGSTILLNSINDTKYKPIIVQDPNFKIEGIVKGIFSYVEGI